MSSLYDNNLAVIRTKQWDKIIIKLPQHYNKVTIKFTVTNNKCRLVNFHCFIYYLRKTAKTRWIITSW